MQKLKFLLICSVFIMVSSMSAQDLKQYQWEKRVLILLTENLESPLYQNQLKDLQTVTDGLEVRKVLVISLGPNFQAEGISDQIKENPTLSYSKLKSKGSGFEVLLFGLDGYEKLRQQEVLTHQELFDIIDRMPMRRAEMQSDPSKRE